MDWMTPPPLLEATFCRLDAFMTSGGGFDKERCVQDYASLPKGKKEVVG